MKKRNLVLAISLAGTMAVGLSGCDVSDLGGASGDSMAMQEEIPVVDVKVISPQTVALTHKLEGFTKSVQAVDIRPQVGGLLTGIKVEGGTYVSQGDLLFHIDDSLIGADLQAAKASLAQAEASWRSAKREADRANSLSVANALSQELYDRAMTALEVSEAAVSQAKATVNRQEALKSYTTIKAPFSGMLGVIHIDEGSLLSANQPQALVRLQDLDNMHLDVKLDTKRYLEIRNSMKASEQDPRTLPITLTLEDGSTYIHHARLLFTDKDASQGTGTYLMRLTVDNPEHFLMPGMYVRAEITFGIDEQALMVPNRAVEISPRGDFSVMVVGEDNIVEKRTVVVGELVDQRWRVLSGLEPGERVVIRGLQKIVDNSEVLIDQVEGQ